LFVSSENRLRVPNCLRLRIDLNETLQQSQLEFC